MTRQKTRLNTFICEKTTKALFLIRNCDFVIKILSKERFVLVSIIFTRILCVSLLNGEVALSWSDAANFMRLVELLAFISSK